MGSDSLSKESSVQERWEWFLTHLTPENRKLLYTLAYSITGNPDDAADVLQDALIQGALYCHQLKNKDRLYQWMFSIVKRLSYRYKNNSMQNLLTKLQKASTESHTSDTALDDYIVRADERARLFAAIEHLKSPAKEIMKLKCSGEWNLRIIAEQLGLNYHTTRSVYQRARRELIKELEAYYNDRQ